MNHIKKPIPFLAILSAAIIGLALGACSDSTPSAPKDTINEIRELIEQGLAKPAAAFGVKPFVKLDSLKTESVPLGQGQFKINLEITWKTEEALYTVDEVAMSQLPSVPNSITLLKQVNKSGEKIVVYGSISAELLTKSHWKLDGRSLEIENVAQGKIGQPMGAFARSSYVTGTKEADKAIEGQKRLAEELKAKAERDAEERRIQEERAAQERQLRAEKEAEERRIREEKEAQEQKELKEKQAQARKVFEAKKRQEEAAFKRKLLQATANGTSYVGLITDSNGKSQRIRLKFTDQDDFMIRVLVTNVDNPSRTRTFIGELNFAPKNAEDYPILLTPVNETDRKSGWRYFLSRNDNVAVFRNSNDTLSLKLSEEGLQGLTSDRYTLRLRNETPPSDSALAGDTAMASAIPDTAETKPEETADSLKQKVLQATAIDTTYIGIIKYDNHIQRIRITFTEQDGFLIGAIATNADAPGQTRKFSGELKFDLKDAENYPIALTAGPQPDGMTGNCFYFYTNDGTLQLKPSEEGLQGEAAMGGYKYTFRLKKETPRSDSAANATPEAEPASVPKKAEPSAAPETPSAISSAAEVKPAEKPDALKQKVLQATATGTSYTGILTNANGQSEKILLRFLEQDGFRVRVRVMNPDNPIQTRAFTGELKFALDNAEDYPILLTAAEQTNKNIGGSSFYGGNNNGRGIVIVNNGSNNDGTLSLKPTEEGLQGVARINGNYTLRLKKASPPAKP